MDKGARKVRGKKGEEIAYRFLLSMDYQILERNYRSRRKEIDLIALDGKELVFVEVKAGRSKEFGEPELRVDKRKQKNLAEAAQAFMAEGKIEFESCRFDVLGIDLKTGRVKHYLNAFTMIVED